MSMNNEQIVRMLHSMQTRNGIKKIGTNLEALFITLPSDIKAVLITETYPNHPKTTVTETDTSGDAISKETVQKSALRVGVLYPDGTINIFIK